MTSLGLLIPVLAGSVILFLACSFWLIVIARREYKSSKFPYFLIPFYSAYYAITRWGKTKFVSTIYALSIVLLILFSVATVKSMESDVSPTITGFMQAGATSNVDKAYLYWVSNTNKTTVNEIVSQNSDIFAGFKGITINSSYLTFSNPQTEECNGSILSGNGNKTSFGVKLVKVNSDWKIKELLIGSRYDIHN